MHGQKLCVSARYQQQKIGKADLVDEPRAEGMAFQMVHRVIGNAARRGDGLGGHCADNDPADQARPAGRGDPVEITHGHTGLLHRPPDHTVNGIKMGARGNFGHHTAMRGMHLHLRGDLAGKDGAVAFHECRCCLVAAALDSEHEECVVHGLPVLVPLDVPFRPARS